MSGAIHLLDSLSAARPAQRSASSRSEHAPIPLARQRYPGELLVRVARDPLQVFVDLAREYGDIVRVRMGPKTFVVVAHPELAREVLVTQQHRFVRGPAHRQGLSLLLGEGLLTSSGDFHRHQRRLAQPAFHHERIAAYARAMAAAAERWDQRWSAREHDVVDMHEEMMALTLGIVGETLFGADTRTQTETVARSLAAALRLGPLALVPGGSLAVQLPFPAARRFRRGKRRLDEIVDGIIAERRRGDGGPDDRGDLLSMLLVATDPDESDGVPMSDTQLRDEVMTLFVAGYETTATAMTWTWYLLAQHPEVVARLRSELDSVLGTDGPTRAPGFDDVRQLAYTRAVLAESMRLYPPAYSVVRVCAERTELGGYVIEKGWSVATSAYLVHHDARWWPEPERFDPDRWLRPAGDRPKSAYFPFGAGSRICIGEPFTWTETVLVLATLARHWSPRLASDQPVRPRGSITLRPAGEVPMRLERVT